VKPEEIPAIKGKDARNFMKQIEKPTSSFDAAYFRKATKVYKSVKQTK
jgi:hypothetical protein